MAKSDYVNRIKLPLFGQQDIDFFTKSSLKIANGYEKITVEKKPIVEFAYRNISLDNLVVPFYKRWREEKEDSPWVEYRSKDYCQIKIKFCKQKQRFYCSLFDLVGRNNKELIERFSKERVL
jgi:hypothetical protein